MGKLEMNLELRLKIDKSGLTYKQIAKELGITQQWLCRLMKKDLSPNNRIRILMAIDRINAREAEDSDV